MHERVRRHWAVHAQGEHHRMMRQLAIQPLMDYGHAAFDLGVAAEFELAQIEQQNPARASPAREALPTARPGFTRSAAEEDLCVCPNCEDELCTGEDEIKRQIFVVKACGHVGVLKLLVPSPLLTFRTGLLRRMCTQST